MPAPGQAEPPGTAANAPRVPAAVRK
jgi:hypothetical protein